VGVTPDNQGDLFPPLLEQGINAVHEHHFFRGDRVPVGPQNVKMIFVRHFLSPFFDWVAVSFFG
jgi:hypothetical protein